MEFPSYFTDRKQKLQMISANSTQSTYSNWGGREHGVSLLLHRQKTKAPDDIGKFNSKVPTQTVEEEGMEFSSYFTDRKQKLQMISANSTQSTYSDWEAI
jgi:hypothetical protein